MTSRAPKGTYLTFAEKLRGQISSGEIPRGTTLPPETTFAREHGIGRTSARKVYGELERDGLVYSVPGQGWIVGSPADHKTPTPTEVADELRAELESGAYEEGAEFTTASQVSNRFGVTKHGAARALLMLEDAGLIVSIHGKGRYVAPRKS
jgi:DNA-binding GntR family transcriptional regulator